MIKIYADLHKEQDIVYIEDVISAHDMHTIKKDDLKKLIDDMVGKYGSLHTSYPEFLNRVGRFVEDYGKRWCGQEFVVYTTVVNPYGVETKKKKTHKYDSSGILCSWPIGYF